MTPLTERSGDLSAGSRRHPEISRNHPTPKAPNVSPPNARTTGPIDDERSASVCAKLHASWLITMGLLLLQECPPTPAADPPQLRSECLHLVAQRQPAKEGLHADDGPDPSPLPPEEPIGSVRAPQIPWWPCLTPLRYYTLSTILGFVALTYGSVPLYKMVCAASLELLASV